MKTSIYWSSALALTVLLAALLGEFSTESKGVHSSPGARRPDLEYLKAVNTVAPPKDPQLLFLLMAQYSSDNLQGEGAEFFSARLKEFGPRLTDSQKALYLSAIGLLRAQHASSVSLLHRIGYVKDTIAILDQAKQLSGGQIFVVNWIAGVVHSELPAFFQQKKAAQEELAWCVENADKAPHAGWLREVYYHLGKLALADGEQAKAQDYLRRTGYKSFDRPITLITPFSEDVASGHAFVPRRIAEIVPGRVYALSGFEFTEYYFVVSDDGQQLIGIDAGTRADSAKVAYEALRAYAPGLPELTTIFVTHSHWDHVGGHKYFRALNPGLRFYARSNYQEEIARDLDGPGNFGKQFFGERFSLDDVRSFKPDVLIDGRTELKIGGTRIELIPVHGGETHDAMFINLPDQGVMFVGDFIMPYLGAPFVEEGDFQGLLDAIDVVVEKHPQHLLHGHAPLTRSFRFCHHAGAAQNRPGVAARTGIDRSPPRRCTCGHSPGELDSSGPARWPGRCLSAIPYLARTRHRPAVRPERRLLAAGPARPRPSRQQPTVRNSWSTTSGYRRRQLVRTVDRLAADGKYELAASLLESSGSRFEHSDSVAKAKRLVYLKLMEKNQNTDPFKFIIYSAKIGEQTPQMAIAK